MKRLFADLTSRGLIHAKGFLFLFTGLLASGALLLESPHLRTFALLAITIWAFCRFYYYLFYVLENYLGRQQKYAGLFDAFRFLFTRPPR